MPLRKKESKKFLVHLTREHIQNAVTRLITKNGVPGLTMEKVALEAGLAKGTLYRHFKTKSDLLRATMDSCISRLNEELFAILDQDSPPDKRLEEMTVRHFKFFDEHRDFFRVLLYERSRVQSKLGRCRSSRYQTFLEKIAAVVDEGIKLGLFRSLDSLKIASIIAEANIAVISHRIFSDHPDSTEKDARILSSVFLHGISRASSKSKVNE